MTDIIENFIEAIVAAGCAPERCGDIIADDKWRSYQLVGDPKHKKAGFFRLKISDGFGVGNFGNRREGVTFNWHSKSDRKWTDEEKQAWKDRIDADKKQQQEDLQRQYAAAAAEAKTRWDEAKPVDTHPYLEKKGVTVSGLRVHETELLVPMWFDGKLSNLQSITEDGDKLYMKGARKQGAYFPITSTGDSKDVLLVGEGLATCASIREATGLPVIVAFDAGNLKPVAEAIRAKYPNARITICADNDSFTTNAKGDPSNTGIIKGQQAAKAIDGYCIWPEFTDNDEAKYTDFNDAHKALGIDYVRERIMAVATPPPTTEQPPTESEGELISYEDMVYDEGDLDLTGDLGLPFRILGHDNGVYYYFPFGKQQIVALTPASHTINNLLQLASLNQWEAFVGAGRVPHSQMAVIACNAMTNIAHARGVFSESARVRGCGAWLDAGRVVLHCGDRVFIDGVQTPFKNIVSHYIYISRPRLLSPSPVASTNTEARALRDLCEMATWENKLSGSLLAGWLVIAPVCAMLKHRPHIWITGETGAGKSTILEEIIQPVLGQIALITGGSTTEAGLREQMGRDGRPLIYDEAEAESQAQKTIMKGVLSLIRMSSTGQPITKYGQKPFNARFAACFSGINPSIIDSADQRRFSMLVLKKNRSPNAREEYAALVAKIKDTITEGFSNRMLARTLKYMPQLAENVDIFTKAAANILKDAGAGNQIGPMLAGLYMLGRTDVVAVERAEEFIRSHNWEFHTNISEKSDPLKLVQYIGTSIVRYNDGSGAKDATIGDLIVGAIGKDDMFNRDWANRTLRKYSIVASESGVVIGNSNQNLSKILRDTAWSANWSRTLSDVPGAEKKRGVYFAAADKQNGIRLPISLFYEGYLQPELKTYEDEIEISF